MLGRASLGGGAEADLVDVLPDATADWTARDLIDEVRAHVYERPQTSTRAPGPCPDTHRDVDVCVWLDDDGALQVCVGTQPDEYLTLTPGQAVVVRVRLRKPVVHDLPVVDVRGVADV